MEKIKTNKPKVIYTYDLVVSAIGGRVIFTNNPRSVCSKCGRSIEVEEWVFLCQLDNKIFCDSSECKKKLCNYGAMSEYHEDTYAPLRMKNTNAEGGKL